MRAMKTVLGFAAAAAFDKRQKLADSLDWGSDKLARLNPIDYQLDFD